jgi:hypothetical protein
MLHLALRIQGMVKRMSGMGNGPGGTPGLRPRGCCASALLHCCASAPLRLPCQFVPVVQVAETIFTAVTLKVLPVFAASALAAEAIDCCHMPVSST